MYALQDEELDISPVDIDDTLVIEEDDISDDEDDDNEDVSVPSFVFTVYHYTPQLFLLLIS